MKITILFLFFTTALFPASALGGCPMGREACPASAKKTSGFLKAVAAAQKAPFPAAAEQKAVPAKPPETPVSAYQNTAAAQKSPESAQGGPSRPAWFLLAGGGLAALYYYLKEGKRKGRKK